MIHLKKYEDYIDMSIPTNIITPDDSFKDYIPTLEPYYNHVKQSLKIKDLSIITHDQIDNYVGFSFILHYRKIMILSDREKVNLLINKELIILKEPKDIFNILKKELL